MTKDTRDWRESVQQATMPLGYCRPEAEVTLFALMPIAQARGWAL